MNFIRFTVSGPPRTKKNSARVVGGRVLPSKAWTEWCRDAVFHVDGKFMLRPPAWTGGPASIRAQFYLDADRKVDAVNLYQGLSDLLESRGCVDDDTVFKDWDGSRVYVDKKDPRVEVTITSAGGRENA